MGTRRVRRATSWFFHRVVRRPLAVAVLVLVALISTSAASFAMPGSLAGGSPADGALLVAAGSPTEPLYPGAHVPLAVRITNTGDHAVTTTSVTITRLDVAAAGACGARDVVLGDSQPDPVDLAGHATKVVLVPRALTMKSTAGNGCQGATFTVQVTVAAVPSVSR